MLHQDMHLDVHGTLSCRLSDRSQIYSSADHALLKTISMPKLVYLCVHETSYVLVLQNICWDAVHPQQLRDSMIMMQHQWVSKNRLTPSRLPTCDCFAVPWLLAEF